MKLWLIGALMLAVAATTAPTSTEAKRLGAGKPAGMQRDMPARTAPDAPAGKPAQAAPQQASPAANPGAAAAPAAAPKRNWMGPLAGLAAGLGLAALASHFGFGEELANMMMIGLLVMVVVVAIGFFMRKKAAQQSGAGGMQYAGAGASNYARNEPQTPDFTPAGGSAYSSAQHGGGSIPADFDTAGFVRNAKVNFIRLQAANDAGNLDDIREFTTPEMFAEVKMGIEDRKGAKQETDVARLEAEVLDVAEEDSRYVVSVRFHGLISEEPGVAAQPFDEIWHMTKPRDGSKGWAIAGIQQVQ